MARPPEEILKEIALIEELEKLLGGAGEDIFLSGFQKKQLVDAGILLGSVEGEWGKWGLGNHSTFKFTAEEAQGARVTAENLLTELKIDAGPLSIEAIAAQEAEAKAEQTPRARAAQQAKRDRDAAIIRHTEFFEEEALSLQGRLDSARVAIQSWLDSDKSDKELTDEGLGSRDILEKQIIELDRASKRLDEALVLSETPDNFVSEDATLDPTVIIKDALGIFDRGVKVDARRVFEPGDPLEKRTAARDAALKDLKRFATPRPETQDEWADAIEQATTALTGAFSDADMPGEFTAADYEKVMSDWGITIPEGTFTGIALPNPEDPTAKGPDTPAGLAFADVVLDVQSGGGAGSREAAFKRIEEQGRTFPAGTSDAVRQRAAATDLQDAFIKEELDNTNITAADLERVAYDYGAPFEPGAAQTFIDEGTVFIDPGAPVDEPPNERILRAKMVVEATSLASAEVSSRLTPSKSAGIVTAERYAVAVRSWSLAREAVIATLTKKDEIDIVSNMQYTDVNIGSVLGFTKGEFIDSGLQAFIDNDPDVVLSPAQAAEAETARLANRTLVDDAFRLSEVGGVTYENEAGERISMAEAVDMLLGRGEYEGGAKKVFRVDPVDTSPSSGPTLGPTLGGDGPVIPVPRIAARVASGELTFEEAMNLFGGMVKASRALIGPTGFMDAGIDINQIMNDLARAVSSGDQVVFDEGNVDAKGNPIPRTITGMTIAEAVQQLDGITNTLNTARIEAIELERQGQEDRVVARQEIQRRREERNELLTNIEEEERSFLQENFEFLAQQELPPPEVGALLGGAEQIAELVRRAKGPVAEPSAIGGPVSIPSDAEVFDAAKQRAKEAVPEITVEEFLE
jgi:hypothetical protein